MVDRSHFCNLVEAISLVIAISVLGAVYTEIRKITRVMYPTLTPSTLCLRLYPDFPTRLVTALFLVVVKLKGLEVTRSEKVKYLGLWIDEGLTWRDHIKAV